MHHDQTTQTLPEVIRHTLSPFCSNAKLSFPNCLRKSYLEKSRSHFVPLSIGAAASLRRSTDLRHSINAGSLWVLPDWDGNPHHNRLSWILSPHLIPQRNSLSPNGTRLEEGTKSFWQLMADTYGSTKNRQTNKKNHKSVTKLYPTLNHKSSKCFSNKYSELS